MVLLQAYITMHGPPNVKIVISEIYVEDLSKTMSTKYRYHSQNIETFQDCKRQMYEMKQVHTEDHQRIGAKVQDLVSWVN